MKKKRSKWARWWIPGLFTVLIVGFTLIVWRKEKSGGSCADQYSSQNPSNPIASSGANENNVVKQYAPPQEAYNSSPNSENYFCRLITPANLPTDYLVIVGIGGVFAALASLNIINRQAVSMRRQTTIFRRSADAAKKGIELQLIQWVTMKNWRSSCPRPDWLRIDVDIVNETSFPVTLYGAAYRVGTMKNELAMEITVVPNAMHTLDFNRDLTPEEQAAYASNVTVFGIRGAIAFKGVSGERVMQYFGGLISASQSDKTSFTSESTYEQSAKDHYKDKSPI